MQTIIGILDNLRSLENVGSIFRTADALGVVKLLLAGTTGHPHPTEPWRRDHERLHKTALGAEQSVAWEYYPETVTAIASARQTGYQIVALELTTGSQPVTSWQAGPGPVALIVGNEVTGINNDVLGLADVIVHIPMLGAKESLNVSVAFGIAAFWIGQIKNPN